MFSESITKLIFAVVLSYFLGNLNPAILVGRAYGVDIRDEGSGNPGTTNVLRTLGKKAAAITLPVDILKGVAAVLLGASMGGPLAAHLCGAAVLIGHVWPVVFKFKGGKGVATGAGVLLATDLRIGLICVGCALAGLIITRMMSWGSVVGAVALPISTWFISPEYEIWALILAGIILFKHRANIARIMKGEEPKIGFSKGKKEQ